MEPSARAALAGWMQPPAVPRQAVLQALAWAADQALAALWARLAKTVLAVTPLRAVPAVLPAKLVPVARLARPVQLVLAVPAATAVPGEMTQPVRAASSKTARRRTAMRSLFVPLCAN